MFVCSVNQQLFNHILEAEYSSGVLSKGKVGREKIQGVTVVASGWEWWTRLARFGLKGRDLT